MILTVAEAVIKSLQKKDEKFRGAQRGASNQENYNEAAFIKEGRAELVCQLLSTCSLSFSSFP